MNIDDFIEFFSIRTSPINQSSRSLKCLVHIFRFCLPDEVLLSFQLVNKSWHEAASAESLAANRVRKIAERYIETHQNSSVIEQNPSGLRDHFGSENRFYEKELYLSIRDFPTVRIIKWVQEKDEIGAPTCFGCCLMPFLLPLLIPYRIYHGCYHFEPPEKIHASIREGVSFPSKKTKEIEYRLKKRRYRFQRTTKIFLEFTGKSNPEEQLILKGTERYIRTKIAQAHECDN